MARSIIIGAGMVGLATAWHLQKHGVDVTVIDRTGVAAGSSDATWLVTGSSGCWMNTCAMLMVIAEDSAVFSPVFGSG